MSEIPKVRDVAHARKIIGDLFGFAPEWVAFAVDELGAMALTDEAVVVIAEAQLEAEFAKAEGR